MSVIAWDGRFLAADRQSTYGDLAVTSCKLIKETIRGRKFVFGMTGMINSSEKIHMWFKKGAKPQNFPTYDKSDSSWARLIVGEIGCRKLYCFENDYIAVPVLDPHMAWGSGQDLAMGALAMGASAKQAVEVACRFNIHCGKGIDVYDLA